MSIYFLLTLQVLNDSHLRVAKFLRKITVKDLSSNKIRTGGILQKENTLVEVRAQLAGDCDILRSAVESNRQLPKTLTGFSKGHGDHLDEMK